MARHRRGVAPRGGAKENRPDREHGVMLDYGPYIGIVVNNVDNKRMGFITVSIPDLAANPAETIDVRYASPFMSNTELEGVGGQYESTIQTSGFWVPQPDPGTEVVVMFPSGRVDKGIWIACLSERFNYHTVPGFASTEFWDVDTDPTNEFENPKTKSYSKYQPAGNFYDPIAKTAIRYKEKAILNPLTNKKPINPYLARIYIQQGLENDMVRGQTTSSAQRETPSNVFGISTKGRAAKEEKYDSAISKLKNKNTNLSVDEVKALQGATRKQGHSFVMDDGDLEGDNELIRLRSSSGHQVLLHDTEGVVYVGNAKGTVWMEFSNDGTVDMYAQDGINMRTKNFNFFADSNINMHAGADFSISVGGKFQVDGASVNLKSTGGSIGLDSNRAFDIKSSGVINLDAGGQVNIKGGSDVKIDGSCVALGNGAGTASSVTALVKANYEDTIQIGKNFWGSEKNKISTINFRIPTHEPFKGRGDQRDTSVTETARRKEQEELQQSSVVIQDVPPTEGPKQAASKPIDRADRVSRGSVKLQPTPNGKVGNLSQDQTKTLLAAIGQRESSGNYQAVNQFGYVGKYQMGLAALEDAGYVKKGTFAQAKAAGYDFRNINNVLDNPNVWTGKNGATGKQSFLQNEAAQEAAMETYTDRNVSTLKRIGVIDDNTPQDQVAGYVMAAHLKGPGDVKKWARDGGTFADGNGTTIDTYYNIGRSAVLTA